MNCDNYHHNVIILRQMETVSAAKKYCNMIEEILWSKCKKFVVFLVGCALYENESSVIICELLSALCNK